MAVGTHRHGPDGNYIAYDKTPVISPAYRLSEEEKEDLLVGLLEEEGTNSTIVNQMLAIERFETVLGIHDHETPNRNNPYPLSTQNRLLMTTRQSIAQEQIRMLIRHKVPQQTNLSLMELMNLPCETFKIVVDVCKNLTIKNMDALEEVEETFDALTRRF